MIQDTYLYREIFDQPQVHKRVIEIERDRIAGLAEEIKRRSIGVVVIAARGTSDNAGRYAKYLLGANNRMVVGLATPSLFTVYKRPPDFGNSLVLGISQSGRSPDIVAVLEEARRQGALTAAITNEVGSDLAGFADFVINLQAGLEKSVAATKTYTSELVCIALLSALMAEDKEMLGEIERIPKVVRETLNIDSQVVGVVQRYRYMRECVVIGRGYNYATAFELALKLKELTYTIVEPYSSADFLHGPLAVIEHGFPVMVIAPSGIMISELKEFVTKLDQRKAEVIMISDDEGAQEAAQVRLKLPVKVPEWLSPVTSIIPGQLFAMHLAALRNYDPDNPRALSKVTETR
jgi:glucosamine--fructose-6-phosphate aminotransferase (isomerizing)